MKTQFKFWMLFIFAIALGLLIGFIDSRPHWDDTGITVRMIIIASAFLGFVMAARLDLGIICGYLDSNLEYSSQQ